jgi:hypothetical protein
MTDNITLRRAAEQARSALNGWANHGLWAWPESALQTCKQNTEEALNALDAALAEPDAWREPYTLAELFAPFAAKQRPLDADMAAIINANLDSLYITDEPAAAKPEPVAWMEPPHGAIRANPLYRITAPQSLAWSIPLYAAPPAAAKPEPTHPGYVIGSHWLETAYSRIAAGESEADVLTEVLGARGWAKRVPDVKPKPATMEQIIYAHKCSDYDGWQFHDGWREAESWHGITKEDKT